MSYYNKKHENELVLNNNESNEESNVYRCITITRLKEINKYVPHKEEKERLCNCCDEKAIIRIMLCNSKHNRRYRNLFLCEDHFKDLKFFINYF